MDLRSRFLAYFAARGHQQIRSSALVPLGDPTLLFTNAGMVPFKDIFTGREPRTSPCATSVQKCLRVGGKHNDLENVGHTARHHTFFEMLGNFSFGDYFKKEAIAFAWEFLTQEAGLDQSRLHVTVFEDDDEARKIWMEDIGIPESRMGDGGEKDNFWSMGATGPCGPCSEIHFDQGAGSWDCPDPEHCSPLCDCDRYLEIWNLVFMQYERREDGSLTDLPNPSIDTGMGLERLVAVVEGKKSNFDSSLFAPLFDKISGIAGVPYGQDDEHDAAMRVLADHTRAVVFLLAEGLLPGNEGRGYVIRRLIRRALRYARLLGIEQTILVDLAPVVIDGMSQAYPELLQNRDPALNILREEEELFLATINSGLRRFEELAASLDEGGTLTGEDAFKLYDTYGFPLDLTQLVARERNLKVDDAGFEQAMEAQRKRARAASRFAGDIDDLSGQTAELPDTRFTGYDAESGEGRVLLWIPQDALTGILITDQTPFYAESGGQTGDTGVVSSKNWKANITACRKVDGRIFVHQLENLEGTPQTGDTTELQVDHRWRAGVRRNHTATHLLQAALRKVLGPHVQQAGSLVEPGRLRFDFSHKKPLTPDERRQVEELVNAEILNDSPVDTQSMSREEALATGAMAFFGEKYGQTVRVVSVDSFSRELCGGTHVRSTGEIGAFAITQESGVASGVRRIEACVGPALYEQLSEARHTLAEAARLADTPVAQLLDRLKVIGEELTAVRARQKKERQKATGDFLSDWKELATHTPRGSLVAARSDSLDVAELRKAGDKVRATSQDAILLLAAQSGETLSLVLSLGKSHEGTLHAGNLLRDLAIPLGARGGGNHKMAQAGGLPAAKWDALVSALKNTLES